MAISPALDLIVREYSNAITVEELARACRLSSSQLNRRFRSITGKPPYEYLADFRMRMAAAQLVETDASILDVALECGYPTLSCFNRHFRRHQGKTPREWRLSERNPLKG